jgi:hypothetical protein
LGDRWKIRTLAFNLAPAPAVTRAATRAKNTVDPQLRQRHVGLIKANIDSLDKNDAAAVAANFTEDAVNVEHEGLFIVGPHGLRNVTEREERQRKRDAERGACLKS